MTTEAGDQLVEKLYRINCAIGIDPVMARKAACQTVRYLSDQFGGRKVYWPAGESDRQEREARDEAIRADKAAGLTFRQVADKHGVSVSQAHRIVNSGVHHFPPIGEQPEG